MPAAKTIGLLPEDFRVIDPAGPKGRSFTNEFSKTDIREVVTDLVRVSQVLAIGVVLSPDRMSEPVAALRTMGIGLVATAVSALTYRAIRSYPLGKGMVMSSRWLLALQAAASVLLAFTFIGACRWLTTNSGADPAPLLFWALLSAGTAFIVTFLTRLDRGVIIVGENAGSRDLAREIAVKGQCDFTHVVASLDRNRPDDMKCLDDMLVSGSVKAVIIQADLEYNWLSAFCNRVADRPIRVRLASVRTPPLASPFTNEQRSQSVQLHDLLPPPMIGWRRIGKRGFDLVFTLAMLIPLSPLLIISACLIRLDSAGPVLFRQWRFGQGSRPIRVYKFRTMHTDKGDETGAVQTLARDPRVTRVGRVLRRLSIDELPQLLNVLRGEMSLVGPRPHPTHMRVGGAYYFDAVDFYLARHRMLPGITGWAQINGSRGEVDTLEKAERRVELDLWYVANWSPLLDIWIITKTLFGGFATLGAD